MKEHIYIPKQVEIIFDILGEYHHKKSLNHNKKLLSRNKIFKSQVLKIIYKHSLRVAIWSFLCFFISFVTAIFYAVNQLAKPTLIFLYLALFLEIIWFISSIIYFTKSIKDSNEPFEMKLQKYKIEFCRDYLLDNLNEINEESQHFKGRLYKILQDFFLFKAKENEKEAKIFDILSYFIALFWILGVLLVFGTPKIDVADIVDVSKIIVVLGALLNSISFIIRFFLKLGNVRLNNKIRSTGILINSITYDIH